MSDNRKLEATYRPLWKNKWFWPLLFIFLLEQFAIWIGFNNLHQRLSDLELKTTGFSAFR